MVPEEVDVLVNPAPGDHAEDLSKAIDVLGDMKADPKSRAKAADRLGRSDGGDLVVKALLGALRDTHPEIRGAAAFSLGRIGDLGGVGPMVGLLQDPNDDVRCRAAVALGLIGSLSVLRSLEEADESGDTTIRWAAIQALGNLGHPAAECLAKALKRGPRADRVRVIVALGETRDISAVDPLAEVLEDDDLEVRDRAREALEKIRESRVF